MQKYSKKEFVDIIRNNYVGFTGAHRSDEQVLSDYLERNPRDASMLDDDAFSEFIGVFGPSGGTYLKTVQPKYDYSKQYTPGFADFGKQTLFNFKSMAAQVPSMLAGLPANTVNLLATGPFEEAVKQDKILSVISETSENASEWWYNWQKEKVDDWIASDVGIQAYIEFTKENPLGFKDITSPQAWIRGLVDLAPSMSAMAIPGGVLGLGGRALATVGRTAGKVRGLKTAGKLAEKAGTTANTAMSAPTAWQTTGFATMLALEGGSMYNEAIDIALENGIEFKDAMPIAGATAAIYGLPSALMERLQFNRGLRVLGLEKRADKIMLSSLMNALAGKGGTSKLGRAYLNQGVLAQLGFNFLDLSVNALEQGVVEGWQQTWNMTVSEAIKRGYGADPETAMINMFKEIGSSAWQEGFEKGGVLPFLATDDEIKQSFFSALFGSVIPGMPGLFGRSRTTYKEFQKALDAGNADGYSLKQNGSRIELYKDDEIRSVFQAKDDEQARSLVKDMASELKERIVKSYKNRSPLFTDTANEDVDVDVDLDLDVFGSINDYAAALVNQLQDAAPLNKFFSPDNTTNKGLSKVIEKGKRYEFDIGQKALDLIKFAKDHTIFDGLNNSKEAIYKLKTIVAEKLIETEASTLVNKQIKGEKYKSKEALKDALRSKGPDAILMAYSKDAMQSFESKLFKEYDIDVKFDEKLEQKISELDLDAALDKSMEDAIDNAANIPDGDLDVEDVDTLITYKKKLLDTVKDMSPASLKDNNVSGEKKLNYLKGVYLKSGNNGLLTSVSQLNNTGINQVAKELGIKVSKKSISTNKDQVLNEISQTVVEIATPIGRAQKTQPTKPKAKKRKRKTVRKIPKKTVLTEDAPATEAQLQKRIRRLEKQLAVEDNEFTKDIMQEEIIKSRAELNELKKGKKDRVKKPPTRLDAIQDKLDKNPQYQKAVKAREKLEKKVVKARKYLQNLPDEGILPGRKRIEAIEKLEIAREELALARGGIAALVAEVEADIPVKLKVKYVKDIPGARRDELVAARTDKKNNQILIDRDELKEVFKNKAWTKPKVDGVIPLPADIFKTEQELEDFVIAHETAHFSEENKAITNIADSENNANQQALIAIGKDPSIIDPESQVQEIPSEEIANDIDELEAFKLDAMKSMFADEISGQEEVKNAVDSAKQQLEDKFDENNCL